MNTKATLMRSFLKRSIANIVRWAVVLLVVAFVLVQTDCNPPRYMYWVFMDTIRAGSFHKLPCRKWPTLEEAKLIMEERADIVRRIENLDSDGRDVFLRTKSRCSGKAELDITYSGRAKREKAREIIGDDKMFFGIPYNMHNF